MSLDQNLFTLSLAPSTEEPTALDLTDPSSNTIHYRKRRHPDQEKGEIAYAWGMYDPLSESLLATITAASATAKTKLIELHNPSAKVELTFTGTLTFKWCFDWEGHTFEWRREACFMLRKPDPPVQVAVTREPAGRIKTSLVQLLDYNLNRFDIQDRKGLEIIMLAALLTFQDQSEEVHNGNNSASPPPNIRISSAEALPGKSGAEIVEQIQVKAGTLQNEVLVAEAGTVEDYAQHCVKMLKDESILYVVVKAKAEQQVPKVVQVAEAAKRMHYKSGGHDQELHQYVKWEDMKQKGPKVIKLDDNEGKKEYKPPQTIIIHLSKIPMPELQPKAPPKPNSSPPQSASGTSRPMNWFGFGAGPSDAKPSGNSLGKSTSATNLRPDSGTAPKLRPSSSHTSSSNSAQANPSRPPQTAPGPTPPKDKNRKDREKKDRLKKPQETTQKPPQQPPPPSGWPGPRPSQPPPSPQMPGAMPPPSPSGQNFFSGFQNAFPQQQPHKPPPNAPAGFPPPSVPPPPPGSHPQQPAQPAGIAGALTNQLANVGYSLLDRLTHNTPNTRPK